MTQAQVDRLVFEISKVKRLEKKCGKCGKIHKGAPDHAQFFIDPDMGGFYWNCDCRSTLFIKYLSKDNSND